jgi:hypothetical protein
MKIVLDANQMFWGLMNPRTLTLTHSLSENNPAIELDESKLEKWELDQIKASVKAKKITISVQVEELIKSESKDIKENKPSTKKKPTKNVKVQE